MSDLKAEIAKRRGICEAERLGPYESPSDGYTETLDALEAVIEALEAVIRNDKTPPCANGDRNALGHPPREPGQRWNTPTEIARAALAKIHEILEGK